MSDALSDDSHSLLSTLGQHIRAEVVVLVRACAETPASVWFDRHLPGDDQEVEVLARFARSWLAGADERSPQVIDGWQVAIAAVGSQAALLAARGPAQPWTDSDGAVVRFAAGLAASAGIDDADDAPPAIPDPNTGLLDVDRLRALNETVRVSAAPGASLTAYVVGVDGLDAVNSVLGYPAGNELLGAVGARLADWVGSAGAMTSIGGARFVALCTGLPDEAGALEQARDLARLLAQPNEIAGSRVSRSVSIGLAHGPVHSNSGDLVGRAIDALRHARAAGGNRVRAFDASAHASMLSRFRLELALHGAAADGSLRLVYQPEFDLRTGELHAVEALLRWQHPERGLLGPDEFIDIAEESYAIGEIGAWVIDEAFGQLAAWQREFADRPLLLRVNLAAAQLIRHGAVELIRDALARHGLRGEQICAEITERAMPSDLGPLVAALDALHQTGASVAIDDFGTDHSTFTHLQTLPVDTIKIDRSFVSEMHEDVRSAAIVAALVRLAHTFGLDVVAEGVDRECVIADLIALGCYRAQGNLLSPARPAAEMVPILRAGRRDL